MAAQPEAGSVSGIMRSLQQLLGLGSAASPAQRETETVRRIAAELDRMPVEQARYLAAFSYVLARVAHADLQISDEELERMEMLVAAEGGLSDSQAALVAGIARYQTIHFGGTEDYLVTRQFRELASREQCLALIRCLYHVAAADGSISAVEDGKIRQIAIELGLTHAEVGALRAPFRGELAELRRS
jgi:uncharacterized tellurite resistance protein B-like protein